ncbi:MAG: hypothetical protein J6T84_01190 [Spirochaetaceae bacterium]|nr:hypothetical protein [Spirochaetaceae bacterium]
MIKLLKADNKLQRLSYYILGFVFFISCFLMLPFCRTPIIKLAGIILHKNLNLEFWNQIILYALVTISSFSFYWLASSFFSRYTKSDKFNLKRTLILISLILFITSLIVQTVVLYNGIVYGLDDPAYVAIAKEMAENTYKTDFLLMQSPNIYLQYSIGYPSLIAGIIKIFGLNFYAIKLVNVFLYTVFSVVLFNFLFSLIDDIPISLSIAILFTLNFTISNWQNQTMSDTPCMVFSLFCLVLINNIYCSKSQKKYLKAVLLGVCLFFAYQCRINGLVCLLAFITMQILICISKLCPDSKVVNELTNEYLKTNWKIHIIPYMIFILFIVLQEIIYPTLPKQDSFHLANSFNSLFDHFFMFHFMYRFFNSAWNEVFNQFNLLSKIAFYLSILLALYGLITNIKKLIFLFFFTIGNIMIYCLWKGFGDIRFYFPLFIPLAVFCAYGAKSIKDNCHSKKSISTISFIGKLSVIMFCAMYTVSIFPFYTENFKETIKKNGHSYSVEAQDIWTYIKKNIPDDKMFIFRSPRELYLYTKHLTVSHDQKADYYLHNFEIPVDFDLKNILSDEDVSDSQIEINGQSFILEYSNAKFRLFHAHE